MGKVRKGKFFNREEALARLPGLTIYNPSGRHAFAGSMTRGKRSIRGGSEWIPLLERCGNISLKHKGDKKK